MSDKLKLADGHGDAEIEKISQAKEMDELNRRIRELEQNVARLKALHEERARVAREAAATKAAGNNKIGARKHAGFKAISTAPSINKTPIGPSMVPLPYPTVQDLSNSTSTARSVRFNGAPAYLLDGTTQPKCTGDEPGTGKGIRSGTVSGEVKPVKGSSTVRIEGKHVVRDGDACTMNGGNNPGIYVTTQAPSSASPKDAIKTSNPPVVLDTHEEKSTFMKIVAKAKEHVLVAKDNVKAAFDRPIEGAKGIVKGLVNIVPSVAELVLKGAALSGAAQVAESEATLTVVGQTELAKKQGALATEMQEAANNVSVPKLPLSNAAQEGGDTISVLASVIAGGVGILKSGARLLGGLGKAGKAAEAAEAAKAAEVASGVGKVDKATGAAAGSAGDGVKVVGGDGAARVGGSELTVSIFGFRGAGSTRAILAVDALHPYVVTGHVGYSFDGGATIYGFGPKMPGGMSAYEAVQSLKKGGSYPGIITNDTAIFESVAKNPALGRDGVRQVVIESKIPVSQAQLDSIMAAHEKIGVNSSMDNILYGFPGKNSCTFNCATFPSELGIPIPEATGNMRNYMPELEKAGKPWTP
ncbi:DUF4150 domain-containing protein [Rugamonas sp. DEMB1]|uniref:DUF4150 domain-containing protein n=1 Tax=Rugamonas sp. DEMB1 TaxID=3039386 RepID=UPI002448EC81|nr:DUF4150 domain-containing protein [Rugamonas sp. DEMB1]WGG52039.1 DUF4150 domain-containing protein [Rugamonas sp. DEMB1]